MSEDSINVGKIIGIILIVVLVLGGGAGGYYWFVYKPAQEAKEIARYQQIAKEEEEKKAKELAEQNNAKYEELIADADAAFEQEDWETAQSLYSEASAILPDKKYAQDQLALVNDKLSEKTALEEKRAAGIVETISSRTGRYYVIVSSSIDDDLAMDYAKKLAQEGNYVKIIEHNTDKLTYFRVAVADYETNEDAENASSTFSSYGEGIWVLRY
ncbi:SPOR domain-containing protein [Marinoscillum sp. MHG1-6]|uniref:SPOR domain-containing protein n=1 Tax=Marinoscillum sp. MHG1-6 TaxID=2959627 RepID=UPI0021570C1C|nr:SPOR domain-containing protein [Marinoscillum sp. MHG1-6]